MDPTVAACPHCDAPVGQPCKDSKGKDTDPHYARVKRADPEVEKWRQAKLKTEREQAAAAKAAPLFAEEALESVRTPEDNYWRGRVGHAAWEGVEVPYEKRGGFREPRVGFFEDWEVILLKSLAKTILPPDLWDLACREFDPPKLGYPVMKWKRLLTSKETSVLKWDRVSHGWKPIHSPKYVACCQHGCCRCEGKILMYVEHIELLPVEVWPPDGYVPPFSEEWIKEFLSVPPPGGPPDDGGLAALVDDVIARSRRAP